MSLTKEVIWGSFNYGICSYIQMAVSIFAEITLARLLLPEDFGKIGYIVSIITVGFMFAAIASPTTIVQNSKGNDDQYGFNAWFLDLAFIAFLFIILLLFAISSERINTYLFAAVMISHALNQLSGPYKAFMQIKMQFIKLGLIALIANVISFGGAIWLAYYKFGYWSLAYKVISLNMLLWFFCWLSTPVRLRFKFDKDMLLDIINFNKYALVSNIFERTFRETDYVTVGKMIGDEGLGFYKRAYFLSELFAVIGFGAISPVFAPLFSRFQNHREKLSQLYTTISLLFFTMAVLFYLITGCLIADIIILLFGSKWLPTVPIFWVIIPYGIICPIRRINREIHLNTGRSKGVTIAQFFEVASFLILLLPFIHLWGLKGVAMAVDIGAVFGIFFLLRSSSRFVDFKIKEIFMKPLLWGIISLALFLNIRNMISTQIIIIRILIQSFVLSVIYISGIIALDKKKIIDVYYLIKGQA